MPEHRRSSRQGAREVPRDDGRHEGRGKPLRHVEQRDADAEPRAERPPYVRGADVSAPVPSDVFAARTAYDPVPERKTAGEVAGDYDEKRLYLGLIWYFDAQSLTVAQSRLSKKASMYEARSVR
jgi:hypothetical protein